MAVSVSMFLRAKGFEVFADGENFVFRGPEGLVKVYKDNFWRSQEWQWCSTVAREFGLAAPAKLASPALGMGKILEAYKRPIDGDFFLWAEEKFDKSNTTEPVDYSDYDGESVVPIRNFGRMIKVLQRAFPDGVVMQVGEDEVFYPSGKPMDMGGDLKLLGEAPFIWEPKKKEVPVVLEEAPLVKEEAKASAGTGLRCGPDDPAEVKRLCAEYAKRLVTWYERDWNEDKKEYAAVCWPINKLDFSGRQRERFCGMLPDGPDPVQAYLEYAFESYMSKRVFKKAYALEKRVAFTAGNILRFKGQLEMECGQLEKI